jgi:hypothetical protein
MKTTHLMNKIAAILCISIWTHSLLGQSTTPGLANRNIAWPLKTPANQFVYAFPGFIGQGVLAKQTETGEDWVYDIKPYVINGVQTGYIVCGFTTAKNMFYSESHISPPGLHYKDPIDVSSTSFDDRLNTFGDCGRRLAHDEWLSQYRSMVGMYDLNGNLAWCKGGNHCVGLNSIMQTADGGFIAIGDNFGASYRQNGIAYKYNPTSANSPSMIAQLPANFTTQSRIDHVVVSKYDANGNEQWSYLYGPESFGSDLDTNQVIYLTRCGSNGQDIAYNPATGGYTILGNLKAGSNSLASMLVININAQGFIVNPQTDIREITSPKGIVSYSLSCNSNECIVASRQAPPINLNYKSAELYKINQLTLQNASGWVDNPIQSNSGDNRFSIFQDCILDNAGNAIVTLMELESFAGGSGTNFGEGSVVKYNSNGVLVNNTSIGNIRAYDMRMGITASNDGGYAIVTSKRSKDANGVEIVPDINAQPWVGPLQNFLNQVELPNYTNPNTCNLELGTWNTDTYVAKLDANLVVQWDKQFDSDDKLPENYPGDFKKQECMYRIATDQDGAFVVVGNSSHNTDDYFAAKIFSDCQNKLAYDIKDVTDNVYETSSSEVWSSPKRVVGKVLIKAGHTLTISNTTIEFADSKRVGVNTRIVVEPGGKLIVTNATLTSIQACEKAMWDGIEVQGNPSLRQSPTSNQGWVQFSNSFVKNAREAVTTRALVASDNASTDWSKTGGGIVTATNTQFIDNRRDVEFMAYQGYSSTGALLNNASSLRLCTFITTDSYGDGGTMIDPAPHITMWKTRNVELTGNNFENLRLNVAVDKKGIGIATIDAAFVVDMSCTGFSSVTNPCPGPNVKSKFTNLYSGVIVSNGANNTAFTVQNALFANNLYGIRIEGAHYGKVYKNNFSIPNAKIANQTKYAFGVYMAGSYGCDIQENVFTDNNGILNNSQAGAANMGVYIANADLANGGVKHYRNDFTNMDVSTQAVGLNNSLQIDCNRFYHTNNALYADISAVNGVLANQGSCGSGVNSDPTLPQANEFYGNCNGANRVQINSATSNLWQYNSFSTADVGITQSCILGASNYQFCSQYNTFNRENSCPTAFPSINGVLQKMAENKSEITNTLKLIDGGDSNGIANTIASETDGTNLRNALLAYSPYLSEASLFTVMNKSIASGQKAQILRENAPFTEKTRNDIFNSDLVNSDKNQLLAITGESPLTTVTNLVNFYVSENRMLENDLIGRYISENNSDAAINYFNNNPSKEALASIIPLTMGMNNDYALLNINNLLNLAQDVSTTKPEEAQLIADYCQMFLLFAEIDEKEGSIYSMNQTEKEQLVSIANNHEELAPLIRNRINFVSGVYPYVDGYELDGKRSSLAEQAITYDVLPVPMYDFNLYPNPATYRLNFDFNLGYQTMKNIQLFSVTGQEVVNFNTVEDLVELDTKTITNGVYLVKVSFKEENRDTQLKKLVIQK